jgi:hypothetical protein
MPADKPASGEKIIQMDRAAQQSVTDPGNVDVTSHSQKWLILV